MTARRASYRPGAGLLFVAEDRLLFIEAADHAAGPALLAAAASEHPERALAAAVTGTESPLPPFVFVQQRGGLEGIAGGAIDVAIDGSNVVGAESHPGAPPSPIAAAGSAVVSSGGDMGDLLWIQIGVVHADAFRWEPVPDAAAAIDPVRPAAAGASLSERLEAEADLTIEAIRLAEMREDPIVEPPERASAPMDLDPPAPSPAEPAIPSRPRPTEPVDETLGHSGADPDQTIEVRLGMAALEAEPRPGTVEALVCGSCRRPNPPSTARCRGCDTGLAGGDGENRLIDQPSLGVIHLADGRIEPLDADIVIGRNPGREPLEPHQRAVVHGEGNRFVSRRHIELRRQGWKLVILNLKEGRHTTVESRRGGHTPLPAGAPHTLKDGDTVHFGRSWFRYEERL